LLRLPRDKQKAAADVAYNIFTSAERYSNAQRRSAVEKVLLPMLSAVHKDALIEFFVSHVRDLLRDVELKLPKVSVFLRFKAWWKRYHAKKLTVVLSPVNSHPRMLLRVS
jgi:hypothetical protein